MFPYVPSEMQSATSSLFSIYASVAAFMMVLRSINDLIPEQVRSYFKSLLNRFLVVPNIFKTTLLIEEQGGLTINELYGAAHVYLSTKVSHSTDRFKVSKSAKQKNFCISIEKDEEISDTFENFKLKWKFVIVESEKGGRDKKLFELSFDKTLKARVLEEYLPFVLAKAKEIKDSEKIVRLYTSEGAYGDDDDDDEGYGDWGSIRLEHPATFETLAMEPEIKAALIKDLDRFLRRKDYYRRVGRAWKRGYLLYGPPGTGKSSLVAAMANYLKFDIYDLELTSVHDDSDLRRLLLSTKNRSILLIEDIDCSAKLQDRDSGDSYDGNMGSSNIKFTLSGLLNFLDGLWSSVGDERIIVVTTNHKDKLDPALLRPGRMDMHIHMSYCTYQGFRILAKNYLGVADNHRLFGEIEDLIQNAKATPAEIAEELMRNEDADIALQEVVDLLKTKKMELSETDGSDNLLNTKQTEVSETGGSVLAEEEERDFE